MTSSSVLSKQSVPWQENVYMDVHLVEPEGYHRFERGNRCRFCNQKAPKWGENLEAWCFVVLPRYRCLPSQTVKWGGVCTPSWTCENEDCPRCGWVVRAGRS